MNLHEVFWATISWMATHFALACVGCVGATYLITVCVNALTRRATHLDDLRRAIAAASLPVGVLLIALTIDPTKVDCALLLNIKWLQVLGYAEPPHIDQRVGHQFHPVVSTLEVLKTQQQPLEFVLPCERPLDALP
jgi:hypothetical protein